MKYSQLQRPTIPTDLSLDHSREILLKDKKQELIVRIYDSRFMFLFSVNSPSRESISSQVEKILYTFSNSLIVN